MQILKPTTTTTTTICFLPQLQSKDRAQIYSVSFHGFWPAYNLNIELNPGETACQFIPDVIASQIEEDNLV